MYKAQRIRDPLHNLIEFPVGEFDSTLWNVIQTPPFQRLRRIKQLGFSDLVYPGATHSRFAHSLGVFHTARQLMGVIQGSERESFQNSRADRALAAALVHDIGHGPFSHAFETFGKRYKLKMAEHENVSDMIIRSSEVTDALNKMGSGFADDVADIVKNGAEDVYGAVVSSQFDADRLDYMRRDRLMTGTDHGAIDFKWLIANLEIGSVPHGVDDQKVGEITTFVLGPKAIHAAEAYVLGLFQLYPTVYFHKTTRGIEKIFTELLSAIFDCIRSGKLTKTGLSSKHPIAKFSKQPDKIENVLALDDTVMWGSLDLLMGAKCPVISELAERLRTRKLFKCIDVRQQAEEYFSKYSDDEREEKTDFVCTSVKKTLEDRKNDWATDFPSILEDEANRSPYKKFQESKGPLNQIMIRDTSEELIDLGDRSRVVKAIRPFKAYRLYVRSEDDKARKLVENVIQGVISNVIKQA